MFQNIKVDIIYYKIDTDFEMEFNLCGCCRMRLLTEKSPDKKIFMSHLARAVSRSKIIIIAGSLFGDDGAIKTVASAIGKKLVFANKSEYNIKSEEDIEIIEGSVPLATSEGYFGGCLIEQGPQTIILLTENKDFRKKIMNNLIHPYVKEVCAMDLTGNNSVNNEPEIKENEETATDLTAEETVEDVTEAEAAATETAEESAASVETDVTDDKMGDGDLIWSDEEVMTEMYNEQDENYKLGEQMITEDDNYLDNSMENDIKAMMAEIENADQLLVGEDLIGETAPEMSENEFTNRNDEANDYLGVDEEAEEEYYPMYNGRGLNIAIIVIAAILILALAVLAYCIFLAPEADKNTPIGYLQETIGAIFGK